MNKKSRKLMLARETLRGLQDGQAERVAGADTYTHCCSGRGTCGTCVLTCGTVYC